MDEVLHMFFSTYRFIIEDNVRFYNYYFKEAQKKYYVENPKNTKLLTYARRNNKLCWNFSSLSDTEMKWALENLQDILANVEVAKATYPFYISNKEILDNWSGDLILLVGDENDNF